MARTPRTTKVAKHRVPPYPHPRNSNLTVVLAYKRSDGPIYESEELALAEQAEIDRYNTNRGFLPWEYCECGCHGHELVVSKGCYFWCYQPEPIGKKFVLRSGHGILGPHIGTFKSWREVDEALVPILRAMAEDHEKTSRKIVTCLAEKTRKEHDEAGGSGQASPKKLVYNTKIKCDKCGTLSDEFYTTQLHDPSIPRELNKLGWRRKDSRDLCPRCAT